MKDSGPSGKSDFPLTNNQSRSGSEDQTQPLRRATRGGSRPRSNFWRYTKWTVATAFCLGAVSVGVIVGRFYFGSKVGHDIVKAWGVHPIETLKGGPLADFTVENKLPADKQHVINVLLLGCDRDYVGKMVHHQAIPVPLNTNGRSDAIMIARFDFDHNTVNMLSIPRDTAVHIPDHTTTKINAAYELGGADLTKETIKEVFGIDTDFYVALHFEAFQKLVEELGGVDVTVHKDLDYDDNWANLHVHLHPGLQHLTGYQAMGYVRIRHSDSDLMRAERQHEFLEALRTKIKTPAILIKGVAALNAVMNNIKTDMTNEELITLTKWSAQVPKANITVATLPSIEGPSYVYVRIKESQDVISKLFFDGLPSPSISAPGPELALNVRAGHKKRHPGDKGASPAANLTVPQADGQMPDGAADGPDAMPTPSTETKDAGGKSDDGKSGGDKKPDGGKSDGAGKDGKSGGSGTDDGGAPATPAVGTA